MNVLHVVESFSSGVAKFIELLVNNIKDANHTILYNEREVSIKQIQTRFEDTTKFIKWKSVKREVSFINDLKALLELNIVIKNNNYEVIHLHSTKAGVLGQILSRFYPNIKFIFSPNGASFARTDITNKTKMLYRFIEKTAWLFGSTHVICVSKSEADLYANNGILCDYIYNGVLVEENKMNNKLLSSGELIISTSGRIAAQKNANLFNLIAEGLIKYTNIKFVWIGDGEDREILTSRNIEITGWLLNEDVKKYLNKTHIYISTASWEGLPFSVLEAMSFKLPLVLSECVGNVDLVQNSINGFTFSQANEAIKYILNYLNDPTLIEKHGLASFQCLKKEFNIDKMILAYRIIYMQKKGAD